MMLKLLLIFIQCSDGIILKLSVDPDDPLNIKVIRWVKHIIIE